MIFAILKILGRRGWKRNKNIVSNIQPNRQCNVKNNGDNQINGRNNLQDDDREKGVST